MKSVYDLPAESPFFHEIVNEVELEVAHHMSVEGTDQGDIDFLYAEPLEDALVDEALRAHDLFEVYQDLVKG